MVSPAQRRVVVGWAQTAYQVKRAARLSRAGRASGARAAPLGQSQTHRLSTPWGSLHSTPASVQFHAGANTEERGENRKG